VTNLAKEELKKMKGLILSDFLKNLGRIILLVFILQIIINCTSPNESEKDVIWYEYRYYGSIKNKTDSSAIKNLNLLYNAVWENKENYCLVTSTDSIGNFEVTDNNDNFKNVTIFNSIPKYFQLEKDKMGLGEIDVLIKIEPSMVSENYMGTTFYSVNINIPTIYIDPIDSIN
jgi:hypothetical protein